VLLEEKGHARPEDIAEATGLSDADAIRGVWALVEAEYLQGHDATAAEDPFRYFVVVGASERARRTVGQWPSASAYDDLVNELERRIASTTDPDRQSKLRSAMGAVTSVGRDLFTDVMAKVIEHQMGIA